MGGTDEKNDSRLDMAADAPYGKASDDGDENAERGNWGGRLDFLLSCLSYAVGLGNVWRFPYLCYRNGGGAFLIPYIIMLAVAGLPLYYMELAFGQYASQGPISIWSICPMFQGIGFAMVTISALVSIYYNMIIAWTLFYLFSSFTSHLPWQTCDNWWNTELCNKLERQQFCHIMHNGSVWEHNGTYHENGTCIGSNGTHFDDFELLADNSSQTQLVSPSDEYFHNYMLDISDGIHDMGHVRWQLALCLLLAWTIVFLCLIKGVKSSGKVVYFTATFPYVVLLILLFRGVTLPGAADGILFYITPQWDRLLDAKVWGDAAIQIFFSLSPCWGGLITLASYNKFHNNCYQDSIIICVCNCGTSVFAGFVIFSVIGFMANDLGVPVEDVASQGAGLAFIAYPEAMTKLPVSPFWSILFFCMLLSLGLGSQFAIFETVTTAIADSGPTTFRKYKWRVVLVACCVAFILGLPCCTRGGMYMLQLMDTYCSSWSVLVIGISECIAISWLYGIDRFMDNVEQMIDIRPNQYWRFMWKFFTPAILTVLLIFTVIMFEPISYGEYVFPDWANGVGWCLALFSILMIPGTILFKMARSEGSLAERFQNVSSPTSDWGPALAINRSEAAKMSSTAMLLDDESTSLKKQPQSNIGYKSVD